MGFQYQDRISQMLTLLEADVARLHQVISNPHVAPRCAHLACTAGIPSTPWRNSIATTTESADKQPRLRRDNFL